MARDNRITIDERYKYLQICRKRYRVLGKAQRGELRNDMERTTGLDRKTLMRHLRRRKIELGNAADRAQSTHRETQRCGPTRRLGQLPGAAVDEPD